MILVRRRQLWKRRQWSYLRIYMMAADVSDDDSDDLRYEFDEWKMTDKKMYGCGLSGRGDGDNNTYDNCDAYHDNNNDFWEVT
ncbi:hypothetical protein DPMN_132219 [Dreissena polymorpha]|uniref:Uncharacterized protein n=1 Tax=Dreissena polymorpha TaxID=45954 RepID=A0A9D4JDK5_DREPO|nr:hypothetical protein DPMN_132219 [Dreissena polymorpha]